MNDESLTALLEQFADMVAERVAKKLQGGELDGWVDQARSPLGRRRHLQSVRSRLARGAPGAVIIGRRYLLTREALEEEFTVLGRKSLARAEARKTADNELCRELRLIGTSRRD